MAPRISDEAKEAKRISILDAALECFSEKGYYASTVDDIVRYAKMSKGSVYNYFTSKENIFIGILQHESRKSVDRLRSTLSQINSPTEKLQHWIRSDIPYDLHKKKLMRVHIEFWLYSTDSPRVKHVLTDRFDVIFEMVREIVKEGQDAGEFKQSVDPEKASGMFWSLHDGLWLHAVIGYDEDKVETKLEEMERVLLAYLT